MQQSQGTIRFLPGFIWGALLLGLTLFSQCARVSFSDNPELELDFSADTVFFDTVFTTVGSVTLPLKVFNPNRESLRIDVIELEGGSDSPFRVNIDGQVGPRVEDWPLLAEDSMWIFIEVTVDPSDATLPFVIEDGIRFNANGQEQRVHLTAWGQNAHFHGGLQQITPLPSCDEV